MYLYVLYLLGWYTYDDEPKNERYENSNDTLENCKFLESRTKLFPEDRTIIKNRDLIIDKDQLRSSYKNVIDELKEKINKNPEMIKN